MFDRPLYVAIALAMEHLREARKSPEERPWKTRWQDYLERCATALPGGEEHGDPPVIDTTGSRPNEILIRGVYREVDPTSGYHRCFDYRVKLTASLARGFDLKVFCKDRHLRQLLHVEFNLALSHRYPPFTFYERKEEKRHVIERVSGGSSQSDLH